MPSASELSVFGAGAGASDRLGNVNPVDRELHAVSAAAGRRSFRLDVGLGEVPRIFHAVRQFQRPVAIARHHHLQCELIVRIQFGMNRNQVDPRRHHFLEIFQHMRPGKRLAFDQFVEKLRLVARSCDCSAG